MFRFAAWLGLLACTGLLGANSIEDFRPGGTGIFVQQRGAEATPAWLVLLYIHVLAGGICLLAVLPQFSRPLLRRFPSLHRRCGIAYALCVLVLLCPTGMVLALSAKGGLLGRGGFLLLGAATFYTTWRGVAAMAIAAPDITLHRRWMVRSFAMVATALSFRVYHLGLFHLGLAEEVNYLTSLWLSILGNAAAAEWILRQSARMYLTSSTHIQTTP